MRIKTCLEIIIMANCPACNRRITLFSQIMIYTKRPKLLLENLFRPMPDKIIICNNCNGCFNITSKVCWRLGLSAIILVLVNWLCFGLVDYLFFEPHLMIQLGKIYYDCLGVFCFFIIGFFSMSTSWKYFVEFKKVN